MQVPDENEAKSFLPHKVYELSDSELVINGIPTLMLVY